jgi:hypothetical protein
MKMQQYRKVSTEVQSFVCEFELIDGTDHFDVRVAWCEWGGLEIAVRGTNGALLDSDEVARRFGFEHDIHLAEALTTDVTTDCDYESLRPLNGAEATS